MSALQRACWRPALLILLGLLVAPIALMAVESFRPFVGGTGRRGRRVDLRELHRADRAGLRVLFLGHVPDRIHRQRDAAVVWHAARLAGRTHPLRLVRVAIFGLLIGLLFMSLIARLYAIQMTWGPSGPLAFFGALIGVPVRSPGYAEVLVFIGLLHFVLPLAALMLIGTFQNINPRLEEAASSLGAPRWRVAMSVTLPLALPGLLSTFMIVFAMCISNFVVPLILGRGVILFTTNLMYTRFSDVANYPSGAAIGVIMFVLSRSTWSTPSPGWRAGWHRDEADETPHDALAHSRGLRGRRDF